MAWRRAGIDARMQAKLGPRDWWKHLRELETRARSGQCSEEEAELLSWMTAEIEAERRYNEALRGATERLLEAIRGKVISVAGKSKRVSVWGKLDARGDDTAGEGHHTKIPWKVFLNPAVTVTLHDRVQDHPTLLNGEIGGGPGYRDVKFLAAEVEKLLPLPDASMAAVNDGEGPRSPSPSSPTAPQSPLRNVGGRPPTHNWEAFWIEVAHYAALHDLDPQHRAELQRHMESWTAENWPDAPDPATIRSRLARLYNARKSIAG
jgi:hypothetical protein